MEEEMSAVEDHVEEWEDLVTNDPKNKNKKQPYGQTMCDLCNTVKHIRREEEELHSNGIKNILNEP